MARFYGEVEGTRGRASRLGSSGMRSHTRGWNVGVEVVCTIRDGRDVIEVYETGGSHAPQQRRLITTVCDDHSV
jgi:hypothetical protein